MSSKVESNPLVIGVIVLCCWYGWSHFDMYMSNRHFLSLAYSALGVVGGIGLLLRRPWARYPIYAITALVVVTWAYLLIRAIANGVYYETMLQTFFGILISFVPPAVALTCSYIVYRRFRDSGPAN